VEILEGAARDLGVRIEDEDAKYFVRVRDLVDYLATRLH
jgi:acyl carrier protein